VGDEELKVAHQRIKSNLGAMSPNSKQLLPKVQNTPNTTNFNMKRQAYM
jgi:hypothetical protein